MKLILSILTLTFVLSFAACADTKKVSEEERVQQMRREIDRLEKQYVPAEGTSRKEVEKKFGAGRPDFYGKVPPRAGLSEDSSIRSYEFASLGRLLVFYDKQWKVSWAMFNYPRKNPLGHGGGFGSGNANGNPNNQPQSIEEQRRELGPRLEQMKRIAKEYNGRFKKKIKKPRNKALHPTDYNSSLNPVGRG